MCLRCTLRTSIACPLTWHRYNDDHVSQSVFVGFRILNTDKAPAGAKIAALGDVRALIWTTTPWTLPANRALCVNADLMYSGAFRTDLRVV